MSRKTLLSTGGVIKSGAIVATIAALVTAAVLDSPWATGAAAAVAVVAGTAAIVPWGGRQ